MDCRKVREFVITDYLDGQMDEEARSVIERHLARCPGCRKFSAEAKKASTELFEKPERAEPGDYLWRRIRYRIVAEGEKRPGFIETIFERLRYTFYIPRPAVVLATILTVILLVGTMTRLLYHKAQFFRADDQGQVEYFDYMRQVSVDTSGGNGAGFGTAVEQYFL